MKKIISKLTISSLITLIFICTQTSPANAITFKIIGKNQELLFSTTENVDLNTNVGQISLNLLKKYNIAHTGSEYGLASIYNIGSDVDVITDFKMKAYGWCFSLDSKVPETMTDATFIKSQNTEVTWFYGYALFYINRWFNQCTPHGK